MIDCISFLSSFRRVAGWLYPVRKASESSYERGDGKQIMFGKTRCRFTDFPSPYFLQFHPRVGLSSYAISVYTGEYEDSPAENGLIVPGTDYRVRLNRSVGGGQLQRSRIGTGVWNAVRSDQVVIAAGLGPDGRIDCLLGDNSTYVWTNVYGQDWQGSNKTWFDGLGDNLGRIPL